VPIAGFAYPSHDARDACIAAIDGDLLEEPTFESMANECRDIGAPLLFFCCREELQWWTLKSSGVVREDTIPAAKVSSFFTEHQEDFSPESIYRAKNLSRVHSEYQLKSLTLHQAGQNEISVNPVILRKESQGVSNHLLCLRAFAAQKPF